MCPRDTFARFGCTSLTNDRNGWLLTISAIDEACVFAISAGVVVLPDCEVGNSLGADSMVFTFLISHATLSLGVDCGLFSVSSACMEGSHSEIKTSTSRYASNKAGNRLGQYLDSAN